MYVHRVQSHKVNCPHAQAIMVYVKKQKTKKHTKTSLFINIVCYIPNTEILNILQKKHRECIKCIQK